MPFPWGYLKQICIVPKPSMLNEYLRRTLLMHTCVTFRTANNAFHPGSPKTWYYKGFGKNRYALNSPTDIVSNFLSIMGGGWQVND